MGDQAWLETKENKEEEDVMVGPIEGHVSNAGCRASGVPILRGTLSTTLSNSNHVFPLVFSGETEIFITEARSYTCRVSTKIDQETNLIFKYKASRARL
jgi:hypothetical protein